MSVLSWSFWIGLLAMALVTMTATQSASGESPNGGGGGYYGSDSRWAGTSQQAALSHYLKKNPDSVCTEQGGVSSNSRRAGVRCVSTSGKAVRFPLVTGQQANKISDKNMTTNSEARSQAEADALARARAKKKTKVAVQVPAALPASAQPMVAGFISTSYDSYAQANASQITPSSVAPTTAFEDTSSLAYEKPDNKGPTSKPFNTNFSNDGTFGPSGFVSGAYAAH